MKNFLTAENVVFSFLFFLSTLFVTLETGRDGQLLSSAVGTANTIQSGVGGFFKGIGDFFNGFGSLSTAREKNEELEKELLYYRGLDRDNLALKNENARLRQLLAMLPQLDFRYEAAQVIAKDPENFFSTLIVNKGSRDGIAKNMSVLAYNEKEGMFGLVGRVISVYEHTSNIMPVFDKSHFVAARLENSQYEGLVSGSGNSSSFAELNYLSRGAVDQLNEGDLVVTSGLENPNQSGSLKQSHYPQGIYIGRLDKVNLKDNKGASLSLPLKSIVNFDKLSNVFIITEERVYTTASQNSSVRSEVAP